MVIAHTGIYVPADKAAEVKAWYLAALKPLGYFKLRAEGPNDEVIGLGDNDQMADWWLITVPASTGFPSHTAFRTKDRAVVDAFHTAALAAGGVCNGPPGVREHYHANYYAAFAKDPLGNNIEVLCEEASAA